MGLDELLSAGQRGTILALVLQELQQLRGTQHAVLARVPVEDLLQLGALQQPQQELLDLSPLQPLVVGVVTLLENRGRNSEEGTPQEGWPALARLASTGKAGRGGRGPPLHRWGD